MWRPASISVTKFLPSLVSGGIGDRVQHWRSSSETMIHRRLLLLNTCIRWVLSADKHLVLLVYSGVYVFNLFSIVLLILPKMYTMSLFIPPFILSIISFLSPMSGFSHLHSFNWSSCIFISIGSTKIYYKIEGLSHSFLLLMFFTAARSPLYLSDDLLFEFLHFRKLYAVLTDKTELTISYHNAPTLLPPRSP